MGFNERWIQLIMGCVKTVSYSVLVNGEPCGMIQPTRGIRQGDPLSPFLFLLCTEGLNGLIKKAENNGEIHGFSLCRRGPKLTHLLFADDSLLFCRATIEECEKVLEVLNMYEEASGQKVNKNKTALFFSKCTPSDVRHEIKVAFGVPEIMQYERYLGLPSFVGKRKKASFNYIKEKIWRKLQGWEGKLLSQAGREVLLKSIIQAIPTYTMGCFKLPIGLCHEIEALIKKFWWGQRGDRRKIHWVKWEEMTKSKSVGGMGFRDLTMYNDSLLAKQAWRLLHNKTSLFYKVFKARFFPNTTIMEAVDSRMGSYAWKSILRGRDVIQRGATWRVGNGEKINIWQQRWLPRKHPPYLPICPIQDFENSSVSCLIDQSTRQWKADLVDGLFNEEDAELVKSIPLSQGEAEDVLFWPYTKNGVYTCKSGYRFLKEEAEREVTNQVPPLRDKNMWKAIWSMQVPQKVKMFIWRARRNAIPTKHALMRRTITEDSTCERCQSDVEDPLHALWTCTKLDVVWNDHAEWDFRNSTGFLDFKQLVSWLITEGKNLNLFALTAWSVWNQRNRARLQEPANDLQQIAVAAKSRLDDFYMSIQRRDSQGRRATHTAQSHWRPPPREVVKVNFDGATCSQEKTSGVGVVVRDMNGLVLASCAKRIHQSVKAMEIEAMAAATALTFAKDLGFQRLILEGDSLEVIQALLERTETLTPTGLLLEDVRSLSQNFDLLLYSHTKRDGNAVAHSLAKYALRIPDFLAWMEDVPTHIQSIVQADLALLH
uniref:Reverse transcriptase domain-containing protein n=1 Tax=Quercus lobata TaxID=97700 RepID=A0A7N2MU32_QUELO